MIKDYTLFAMIKHLVKKFLFLLCSLFVVVTLTFFLMHAVPGDPFSDDQIASEEILRSLRAYFHLDEPLLEQFGRYLYNLLHLDFGPSLKYSGRNTIDMILEGFPVSMILGIEALLFTCSFGIFMGTIAAIYRNTKIDRTAMVCAVFAVSVPSFILATFLQYLFAIHFPIFPVARWGNFMHTVLPSLSLAALPSAFIARLTRANMIEVLEQDYILTARSKGLSTFTILVKHVMRNTLLPIVSYLGPLVSTILTGSFVVERIFGIPGLGQWFVFSIMNRDYTLIMALTIFYSAFLMLCVYFMDVLYCLIDPRIRLKR